MNPFYKLWLTLTKPAELVIWLGEGARSVPYREAKRRASICMCCPNNQPGALAIEASALAIKNKLGLKLVNEDKLGMCVACGCALKVKVWVPYNHIKAYSRQAEVDDMRKANEHCWQL